MRTFKLPEALIDAIEAAGFAVMYYNDGRYDFSKVSPYGQDFGFQLRAELCMEQFAEDIQSYYDNFDVSTEAYLWLNNSGHGTNGAPYEMEDVLADMKSCREYIHELWVIVNGYMHPTEKSEVADNCATPVKQYQYVVCLDSSYIRDAQMVDTTELTDAEFESGGSFGSEEHEELWHDMEPNAFIDICNAPSEEEACKTVGKKWRYDHRCLYAIKVPASSPTEIS